MIKVQILNKQGTVTHGGQFETIQEANAWIGEVRPTGAWGKTSGVYNESQLSEQERIEAIEIFPEGDQQFFERQFQIQDQFTIVITDITEELAKQKRRVNRKKSQEFGAEFMELAVELNKDKFLAGHLSLKDLDAMDEDPKLQKIERAAWRGNIPTLKILVENYEGLYYTLEDKTFLLNHINDYLARG